MLPLNTISAYLCITMLITDEGVVKLIYYACYYFVIFIVASDRIELSPGDYQSPALPLSYEALYRWDGGDRTRVA